MWQILTFTLIKCTDGQLVALETKRTSFPVFGRWAFSYGQGFLAIAQTVIVLFSLYYFYCCCTVVAVMVFVLLLLDCSNCSVTLLLLLLLHSYCTVILFVVLCHLKFFR